jgi:N-acetylneuraminic acid mutarotase
MPAPAGQGDRLSALVAAWHLPRGVSRSAVLTDGASLLVLGGLEAAAASTATVVRIDPAAGVATDAGRLATPTHDAAGALIGSTAFVFGGGQRVSSDTVQSFAPGSGSARGGSRIAGRLPRARADLSAVSVDGRTYLVGGWDGSSLLSAVLETDDGVHFRTAATLPVAVRYPAATAADGAIWVFGGERNGSATPVVQRVDPSAGRATLVGRLPVAVSGASAITLGGSIYLVGGRVGGTPTNRIWRFDPATRTCYPAGTLPYPVANASAAVAGDVAYLIGGEGRGTLETVIVLRRAGQVPTPAG